MSRMPCIIYGEKLYIKASVLNLRNLQHTTGKFGNGFFSHRLILA